MWVRNPNGEIVWREGATRQDYPDQPRVGGFLNPYSPFAQQVLASQATGRGGFFAADQNRAAELRAQGRETSRLTVSPEAIERLTRSPWEIPDSPPALGPTLDFLTPEQRERAELERILELFGDSPDAAGDGAVGAGEGGVVGGGAGGGSGGGGVGAGNWASLFRLYETPEEQAMLAAELADLDTRQQAGEVALRAAWGNVQSANSAAAEKARGMAAGAGSAAAAIWTDAAAQAGALASERAATVGGFEGRAGIDIDPSLGASEWIGFMESQAPAERAFAERRQEALGRDLDWMAGLAGMQGEAYAGDLQRQAAAMAFDRAADHNRRVQDRISQERMMLAQMQFQSDEAARQRQFAADQAAAGQPTVEARIAELAPVYGQLDGDFGAVLMSRDLGISLELARQAIQSWQAGPGGRSVEAGVSLSEAQVLDALSQNRPQP